MSVRFTFGKSWPVFEVLASALGVRGSLFAAFAVIAGMAIVISAGAGLVLRHLGGTMVDLSGRDIPRLAASLQLAAQSASLASQGPALLASGNAEALNERTQKMKETQQVALAKLGEITELGADKAVVSRAQRNREKHRRYHQKPGRRARERLETAALHREAISRRCARRRPASSPSRAQR